MKFFTKKRVAILAVLVVVAISAVAAYAYFTSAGSGQGFVNSGQIGATVLSSDTVGPLYPQTNPGNTTAVTVHVNNTGGGDQYVGQITGTVEDQAGCSGSWFSVAPVAAPGLLSPGSHDFVSSVILNDNGGNQNACANKTLTIDWASAAG